MARKVDEWIGKTDDSMPPQRVRMRVFKNCEGICHISGRKIQAGEAWDLDHIIALADGGENKESNLAPALKDKHLAKTAKENAERAIIRRKTAKHIGTYRSKTPMPKRPKAPKPEGKPLLPKRGGIAAQYRQGLNQ